LSENEETIKYDSNFFVNIPPKLYIFDIPLKYVYYIYRKGGYHMTTCVTSKVRAVKSILGSIGRERGKRSESRVVMMINELGSSTHWISGARHATTEEDRRLIDVVVETDVGKIFIQIKGCRNSLLNFELKKPRAPVILGIVVNDYLEDHQLKASVLSLLLKEREKILQKRNGSC